MTAADFASYAAVAAVLAWVPGPTIALIAANSLRYGFSAGFAALVGTQLGYLLWLAAGVFALGFLSADSTIIAALRWVGAVYLAWLAYRLYASQGSLTVAQVSLADKPWVQGFFVILVNPKMLVLFGSLIPQYLASSEPSRFAIVWLGLVFMLISTVGDLAYALGFAKLRDRVSAVHERRLEIVSALCLVAGALWLAYKGVASIAV